MSNSKAFNLYVNEQFIKPFRVYLPDDFDINDDFAENTLISAMCWYLSDKIYQKIDFGKIKTNYINNLTNISPNKDYIQAKKVINHEQTKLETYARIMYYIKKIEEDYFNLDTAVYLYIIYAKLNKKSIQDIKNNRVYKYLNLAYAHKALLSLNDCLPRPLSKLSKDLQESVESMYFNEDSPRYISSLDKNGNIIIYTADKKEFYNIPLSQEEISEYIKHEPYNDLKNLFIAEQLFKQSLSITMRTQNNEMIF